MWQYLKKVRAISRSPRCLSEKEGRKKVGKEGSVEVRWVGRREGRKEGREEGNQEARKKGRESGSKCGSKCGRKERKKVP
jgi:hypothetical protein